MDSLSDDHIEIKVPPSPIPVTITAPDETTPLQQPLQNGSAKLLLPETIPVWRTVVASSSVYLLDRNIIMSNRVVQ